MAEAAASSVEERAVVLGMKYLWFRGVILNVNCQSSQPSLRRCKIVLARSGSWVTGQGVELPLPVTTSVPSDLGIAIKDQLPGRPGSKVSHR